LGFYFRSGFKHTTYYFTIRGTVRILLRDFAWIRYNLIVEKRFQIPQPNKLSIVSACILICYTTLPFIQLPAREIPFSIAGIMIPLRINFYNLMSLIAAAIAAAGADWMLRDHPLIGTHSTLPHLILPALSAGALGFPLGILKGGIEWWIILAFGSLLIIMILVAEFISMDSNDSRYPLALMVLSAVSYGIFFLISIALRAVNSRLYLMLLILPSFFVFLCLRILHFRLGGRWRFEWTAVITLIVSQCIIAFYYWPLTPIRFGLMLLGPVYALIGIAASLEENPDIRNMHYDPLIVMAIVWVLGIFIK
jgi:hypothetical protein